MAALVDRFVEAARDNNVSELRRCISAGVDKDGFHSSGVWIELAAVCSAVIVPECFAGNNCPNDCYA
jgi:hypothetical protein